MPYYLAPYVGTGVGLDPFRPRGLQPGAGSIDLRPDPSVADGFALLHLPVPDSDPQLRLLGDDPDGVSAAVRAQLQTRLGLTLNGTRLRTLVPELLIEHAGGSRWKPLQATRSGVLEIFLGGTEPFWTAPAIRGGSSTSDDFNREDSVSLGASWTEAVGTTFGVTGNMARIETGGDNHARWETAVGSANHACQLTAVEMTVAPSTGFAVGGPAARYSTTDDTLYVFQCVVANGGSVNEHGLAKWITGTETYPIGSIDGTDFAADEILKITCDGSSIKGWRNGSNICSATDTSITTGTRGGMRGIIVTTGSLLRFDDWSLADIDSSDTHVVAAMMLVNSGGMVGREYV